MSKRNKIIVGILLAVSILVAGNEIYQYVRGLTADYPDNDINGYIAWAAGGATDTTSRGISVQAQKFLGTNIVMQNKDACAFTEQFIVEKMKEDWGINRQNQLLFVWYAIHDKVVGEDLYDGEAHRAPFDLMGGAEDGKRYLCNR